MVTITLNGDRYTLDRQVTLAALLERLRIDPRTVAVELNQDIVRRDRLAETPIEEGDRVEVVRMIGGG